MNILFALMILLLCVSCGKDRDNCSGVDTSQAPISITEGESMTTKCWTDSCCIIYYH